MAVIWIATLKLEAIWFIYLQRCMHIHSIERMSEEKYFSYVFRKTLDNLKLLHSMIPCTLNGIEFLSFPKWSCTMTTTQQHFEHSNSVLSLFRDCCNVIIRSDVRWNRSWNLQNAVEFGNLKIRRAKFTIDLNKNYMRIMYNEEMCGRIYIDGESFYYFSHLTRS